IGDVAPLESLGDLGGFDRLAQQHTDAVERAINQDRVAVGGVAVGVICGGVMAGFVAGDDHEEITALALRVGLEWLAGGVDNGQSGRRGPILEIILGGIGVIPGYFSGTRQRRYLFIEGGNLVGVV